MDPLSITAAIISVVQITGKVISTCSSYITAVKDAPSDLRLIVAEVASLQSVIRMLDMSPGPPSSADESPLDALNSMQGVLKCCEKVLQELDDLLERRDASTTGSVGSDDATITGAGHSSKPKSNSRLKTMLPLRLIGRLKGLGRPSLTLEALAWPTKQRKVQTLLTELAQYKQTIALALAIDSRTSVTSILARVDQLTLKTSNTDLETALTWLNAPNVSEIHYQATKQRHPGTCAWVSKHTQYIAWKEHGGLLWIIGTAGSGKTVLLSAIIQQLLLESLTPGSVVLYFYFDHADSEKRSMRSLLLGLASQILQEDKRGIDRFKWWLESHPQPGFYAMPQSSATTDLLESLLNALIKDTKSVIVVDALDECNDVPQTLRLLYRLKALSVSVLFTSRPSSLIRRIWTSTSESECHRTLHILPELLNNDIRLYAADSLGDLLANNVIRLRNQDLRTEIIDVLSTQSNGMFQWVTCQLKMLCEQYTDDAISATLRSLPVGLIDTYRAILDELPLHNRILSKKLFQWVAFSHRPLNLAELSVAVSINDSWDRLLPSSIITDPFDILHLGGNLITYDPETQEVTFIHYTVREYLLLNLGGHVLWTMKEDVANAELARLCLNYLHFESVVNFLNSQNFQTFGPGQLHNNELAFAHYATKFWLNHAQRGSAVADGKLCSLVSSFFFGVSPPFLAWRRVYERSVSNDIQRVLGYLRKAKKAAGRANITADPSRRFGNDGMSAPPQGCSEIQLRGGDCHISSRYGGAYSVPSSFGHYSVSPQDGLKSLLLRSPHITVVEKKATNLSCSEDDFIFMTGSMDPIHYLARFGLASCIETVLKSGAMSNTRGGLLNTSPLHEATKSGSLHACRVLLGAEAAVLVDQVDMLGRTPLFYAVLKNNIELVDLLLNNGTTLAHRDWYGSTALHEAVRKRSPQIVSQIINQEKDRHRAKGVRLYTGLDGRRYLEPYRVNLDEPWVNRLNGEFTRVNPLKGELTHLLEASDLCGENPLSLACRLEEPRIVATLLGSGAYWPICLRRCSPEFLGLVAKNCVSNLQEARYHPDGGYVALLHRICEIGDYFDEDFATALLDNGYPLELRSGNSRGPTVLSVALVLHRLKFSKFLLNRGAICHGKVSGKPTSSPCIRQLLPFRHPRLEVYRELMKVMLSRGCSVGCTVDSGSGLLNSTIKEGQFVEAQILISLGVKPLRESSSLSIIHLCADTKITRQSRESFTRLIKHLLKSGYSLEEQDFQGRTPLLSAVSSNNFDVAEVFVHLGANVCARDATGKGVDHYLAHAGFKLIAGNVFERARIVRAK